MKKSEFYLRNARLEDLDEIMNVENQSFDSKIQEKKSVFKERIETFSKGFLVFEVNNSESESSASTNFATEKYQVEKSEKIAAEVEKSSVNKSEEIATKTEKFDETKHKKIAGYFCTELWEKIPKTQEDFTLGHDIKKVHSENGKILYISSFALLKEFRGNGNGKKLFSQSLDFLKSKLNFEKILLLVNENWLGAKKIYLSYGFKELFACKNIFLNDEKNAKTGLFTSDGIVMLLDFVP